MPVNGNAVMSGATAMTEGDSNNITLPSFVPTARPMGVSITCEMQIAEARLELEIKDVLSPNAAHPTGLQVLQDGSIGSVVQKDVSPLIALRASQPPHFDENQPEGVSTRDDRRESKQITLISDGSRI